MLAKRKSVAVKQGSKEACSKVVTWPALSEVEGDRNRIRGSSGWTSWHKTTKSISIKVQCCKFGRCAAKVDELTSGGLRGVSDSGLRQS